MVVRKKQKESKSTVAESKSNVQDTKPSVSPEDQHMQEVIKTLEQAFFTFKFYPVAAKEDAKEEAITTIKKLHRNENETVRQLVLYMLHEQLSQVNELKMMHNYDHFKARFPNNDASQIRMNVYRAMFNYNNSIEGLIELVKILGELEGDDAAKLLTYHFSFLSSIEVEATHMIRNAIVDALGESKSEYALKSLLSYARTCDSERLLQRIAGSLARWDQKIDELKITLRDKERLKEKIHEVMALEFGDSHYG